MGANTFQSGFWNSTEQMEIVLSKLQTGLVIIDQESRFILEINDTVCTMSGYSKEEIVNHSCSDILCKASRSDCPVMLSDDNTFRGECSLRTKNGGEVPILKTVSSAILNGRPCLIESIVDISTQKKVENRLREERERVEKLAQKANEANQAKSEFLANISHELRTPLNGVVGMASLLKDTNLTEDQQCYAETMYICAESLIKLVNGVLDYSNLEAGQIELSNRKFIPQLLMGSVVELVREPIQKKNLHFKLDITGNVSREVIGDSSRLQQVLMIFVENAMKFTDKGEIALILKATASSSSSTTFRFAVRDSGIGIPIEKHEFVFDKFTQVDSSTTRRHGGTGLGLATAREIVRLMKGQVGLRNVETGGTEFWFEVDLPNAAVDSTPATKSDRLRFLVVDDSQTNREVLASLLKKMGCTCDTAANGEEAIEKLSHSSYSLVFMDIQMPVMNGIVTTKAIRAGLAGELMEDVPIVALSASSLENDRTWHTVGMNYCLTKPVSPTQLENFLSTWFPSFSTRPEKVSKDEPTPTPPSSSTSLPIFDHQKLRSRLMGDDQILKTVMLGFIEDIPKQIENLSTLIETGEMEGARIRAHGIKGASATVCAEQMFAHCARMEEQAQLGDSESLQTGLKTLRTLFKEVREFSLQAIQ